MMFSFFVVHLTAAMTVNACTLRTFFSRCNGFILHLYARSIASIHESYYGRPEEQPGGKHADNCRRSF